MSGAPAWRAPIREQEVQFHDCLTRRRALTGGLLLCALGLTLAGCSADYYRRQADEDAYRIIGLKQREVLGREHPFSIDATQDMDKELQERGYDRPLSPEAMSPRESGSAMGASGGPPRLAVMGTSMPAQVQMSAMFDSRVDVPPVGELIDASPPAAGLPTTQPESTPSTQPDAAGWDMGEVEIPPIASGGRLFVEPGNLPPDMRRIDLLDALQLAALNSRNFQNEKESVYLASLRLTGQRHTFESQFFGTVDASLVQDENKSRSGSVDSALGFSRNFTTGGAMALTVSNTLFEVFTDPTGRSADSAINLALSQPILRGAGYRVAAEPLIQADRDVTYAVREFERYKRELAVSIATSFYQVLQSGDQVANERNNYANLIRARQRTEAFAQAGRLPQFEVDQAQQDELRARNRWVVAIAQYNRDLDDFRRVLGVPTDWPIVPDPAALHRLAAHSLEFKIPDASDAVSGALSNRLDLMTVHDQVEDAARTVYVTADALRTGLNLTASADVGTEAGHNKPIKFRFGNGVYSIGALLDLPLDRLDERNAFRTAIIDWRAACRSLTDRIDQVSRDVRDRVRSVTRAVNSYRIQESAVKLASRRVESTALLLKLGRATTRDYLEAQSALVEAQNAQTAALVDYHIARLELLRDMEVLQVEPAGLTYHDPTTDR
ncbi:MAG: hypothetical protein BIFFINMI_04124 [Phycisphaerae bacterium]|nr:hypothetical protein [Phycisphaerae bacterium]